MNWFSRLNLGQRIKFRTTRCVDRGKPEMIYPIHTSYYLPAKRFCRFYRAYIQPNYHEILISTWCAMPPV